MNISAALAQALEWHQAHDLARAGDLYRQILQAAPNCDSAWHLLGLLTAQSGDLIEGARQIERAIEIGGSNPQYIGNLGEIYRRAGDLVRARACLELARELAPVDAGVHNNLGLILQAEKRFQEARAAYETALQLDPAGVEAFNNLGTIHQRQGHFAEAAACFERALRLRPDYCEAANNLGAVHIACRNPAEARRWFERALQIDPHYAEAWNNLGATFHGEGLFSHAMEPYRRALQLKPDYVDAHVNMASASVNCGDISTAHAHFAKAIALGAEDGVRVNAALVLPIFPASVDEIHESRRRMTAGLEAISHQHLVVENPVTQSASNHFYLAYQGLNDRELNRLVAGIYRQIVPDLEYTAPHCRTRPLLLGGRKIRLGIVSAYLYRHSIGRLSEGFFRHLSRDRFEVAAVAPPVPDDECARRIAASADRVLTLTPHLERAREEIAKEQFDILFYPDVGMEPLTYFLAFARLAPVQCASWGHPVTTGIPNVDYFVSARDLEPLAAAGHYSERLVELSAPPTCFERPSFAGLSKVREEFGLDSRAHLYLTVQSLFKIHPDFDDVLAGILRADLLAQLAFVDATESAWKEQLTLRWARRGDIALERIRFVPRQGHADFLQLLAMADVSLDTLHFSGGVSSLESLAVGTPIVTMPGAFMRSRPTYAYYRQMGVNELVATDLADYVRIASRLGTDPRWRQEMHERILAASSALFDNRAVVRELEEFFISAADRAGL